jgi:endoglucanase
MHPFKRTRVSTWITIAIVVLAMLAALIGANRPALAAPACQVTYTPNTWNTGFTAEVKITNNTSAAIQGWTLTWAYANGQQITGSWNATVSQTGANVSASNVANHWNGTIGANGGTASFGVQGTHTGTNTSPTVFVLNGVTCGDTGPTPTFTATATRTNTPTVTNTPTRTNTPTPTATGPTPTFTATATRTNTPTPTRTNTPTPTNTPFTPQPGGLKVQYRVGETGASVNQIRAMLNIVNTGSSAVPLSELKVRYWYTIDGVKSQEFHCDYAVVGCSSVSGVFQAMAAAVPNQADYYYEVSFGSGSIAANGQSGEIQTRINKTDWTNYTQTNDYSFDATKTAFADWTHVTLYRNGVLVWGTEPVAGTPTFTPTPTQTGTPTRTPTPTATSTPCSGTCPTPTGRFRVDAQGRITKNGVVYPIHGGSWFGLQGRYEPASDSVNPRGAPMEQYIGNVFWAPSGRTITQDLNEMKALGINVIRLPLSHQTLSGTDPQGMAPNLKNDPAVRIANSRLALETIIKAANTAGIDILLDIHSCSNYVDWRKGRLDARPPYVDATRDNYDFKREDSSCAASNNPASVTRIQAYNETIWLQDLQTLAGLESTLGVTNIIGIDIFNEPWDYTWAEWKTLSEHAYTTINAVNPNILIFVQGISASAGNQDGTPTTTTQSPHGSSGIDPNWGENLFEAGTNPPNIPRDRLVFSPHAYGPSVFVGKQFMDPAQTACTGLEGDAAGDAQCNIVINPTLLRQGWEEHFGYLKALGYAVVVGEFGGNMDWPHGTASLRDQNRFGYLPTDTTDQQWQNAFVDYLISKGITDTIYWSINPESGDTGGIYSTPYRAGTNESGWGTWGAFDSRKVTLLRKLWGN